MKRILFIALSFILAVSVSVAAAKIPDELLADAVVVFKEIAEQPDSEQLHSLLKKAHGIAIFPSVVKAGLGLGGRYGEGVILKYDAQKKTWYGPYFVNMKGISYGFQVGVQSTALVLVVATEAGIDGLQDGKITLGGNLSIAAGPMGRSAEASTDLKLEAAIYSYSMSKGAFIGASFEGSSIDNTVNANYAYWNEKLTPQEILKKKASGKAVQELLKELNKIINKKEVTS